METPKVLFVDDEQNILKAIKRMMRSEPYEFYFAGGGQEALDLLERENVHVIVTDLGMPVMNGLKLLKQVQAQYPNTIRLVLSAFSDTDSILSAVNEGNVYRYVVKPWNGNVNRKLTTCDNRILTTLKKV